MAHGITFVMYERGAPNVRAEVTVKNRKVHVTGLASLTLALNQHKYGDEIIFQIFTRDQPEVLERRADGWTRTQIYGGQADIETVKMLLSVAKDIMDKIERGSVDGQRAG